MNLYILIKKNTIFELHYVLIEDIFGTVVLVLFNILMFYEMKKFVAKKKQLDQRLSIKKSANSALIKAKKEIKIKMVFFKKYIEGFILVVFY
jgi:hypothetical protein